MSTRTPFVFGSMVGVVGTVALPLNLSLSSPGGVPSLLMTICGFVAGAPLVHGSHASPMPSLSPSACEGLGSVGQLSCASQVPSLSPSGSPVSAGQAVLEPVQVSAMSHALAAGRQTVDAGASWSAGQPL